MKRITYSLDTKAPKKLSKAAIAKLDAIADDVIDTSDIPELDEAFFAKAKRAVDMPASKTRVTIRLDADVVEWLKEQGKGYQTRVNRILRAAMEHKGH